MAVKPPHASDPLLIQTAVNTSYTVFFIVAAVAWAKIFSGFFPASLKTQAFVLSIIFALMLYVFRYFLLQFENPDTLMTMVLLYFSLSAVMTFASAVRGPLADGTIPAIQFSIFGAHVYSSATPSYIVASIFSFYGGVTLICATLTAAILERIYNLCSTLLPAKVTRRLIQVDAGIDNLSLKESMSLFYKHQWYGVLATIFLLATYTAAYLVVALR